jgi:putative transposase
MARFEIPDGWTMQAFQFTLDCTAEQAACVRRQFGGRRYGRNWAVRTLKEDLSRYRETGEGTDAPSLTGLRKRWNQVKDTDAGTLTPARCGGLRSARRRSPTASRPR